MFMKILRVLGKIAASLTIVIPVAKGLKDLWKKKTTP